MNEEIMDDGAFIRHVELWPHYPLLPIKRHIADEDGPECCLLLATAEPWSTVYACNLFALPKTVSELRKMNKYTYPSVEALLADGWRVD